MKIPKINKVGIFNMERERKLFRGEPMYITLNLFSYTKQDFHIFRKKLWRTTS